MQNTAAKLTFLVFLFLTFLGGLDRLAVEHPDGGGGGVGTSGWNDGWNT